MAWTDICAVVDINARRTPPAACCAAVEVLLHQKPFPSTSVRGDVEERATALSTRIRPKKPRQTKCP